MFCLLFSGNLGDRCCVTESLESWFGPRAQNSVQDRKTDDFRIPGKYANKIVKIPNNFEKCAYQKAIYIERYAITEQSRAYKLQTRVQCLHNDKILVVCNLLFNCLQTVSIQIGHLEHLDIVENWMLKDALTYKYILN